MSLVSPDQVGQFGAYSASARQIGRAARSLYDRVYPVSGLNDPGRHLPRWTPPRHGIQEMRPTGTRRYAGFRSGRSNRVVSRKRGRTSGRRRKLRFGTRVRKEALGLFEGKRHGRTLTVTANNNIVGRWQFMDQMRVETAPAAGVPQGGVETVISSTFEGYKFHVRGIKAVIHVTNKSTTAPVDVRVIFGWRKKPAIGTEIHVGATWGRIFKDRRDNQEPVLLSGTQEYADLRATCANAPLASGKYFHCAKDMVVRLGPSALDTSEGSSFRMFPVWWELNNKLNRIEEDFTTTVSRDFEKHADWYPVMYYMVTNPSDAAVGAVAEVDFNCYATLYYKDPRG